MRFFVTGTIILCLAALGVAAQELDGREIAVKAGGHASSHVPIEVAYDGPVPPRALVVEEAGTGKTYPATVRNGALTFVAESLEAGAEQKYTVRVQASTAAPVVRIEKRDGEAALDVHIRGQHFTTYHYSNENKKPFFWPVLAEGGVEVTRAWPMGPEEESTDHVHQKSMWQAYGDINGVDFWAEGQNSGRQYSERVEWGSGDAYGWIRAHNTWQDRDGNTVVHESREYKFYASPENGRLFDASIAFNMPDQDLLFGDTKEGGVFAVRVRDTMRASSGGVITNAEGLVGESETWGKPSAWCDYSGPAGDKGIRGITVMDHPDNLRHPTRWHVRNYGLMGANVFGLSYFTETRGQENEISGDYTLKAGDTLEFSYRILVHSGGADDAQVADRFADYTAGPSAEWTDAIVARN